MDPALYQTIKKKIRNNSFQPGEPLSERKLAQELKVSRSPVREVLKALEQEGFVRIVPQRGAFVTSLSLQDIREIFELREALDTFAIRRVALNGPRGLNQLAERFERLRAKGKKVTFQEMRSVWKRFFKLILNSLDNQRFSKVYSDLYEQVEVVRGFSTSTPERIAEAVRLGTEITRALLRQDAKEAERLFRLHRKKSREAIAKAFAP